MFNGWLFIFLAINLHSSSCVLEDIYNTGRELWKLYSMLDKITFNNARDAIDSVQEQEITNQVNEIHKQLESIESNMTSKKIKHYFQFATSDILLLVSLDKFELSIGSIDQSYQEFQQYAKLRNHDADDPSPNWTQNLILKIQGEITYIRSLVIGANHFRRNHDNLVHAASVRAIVSFQLIDDWEEWTLFTSPEKVTALLKAISSICPVFSPPCVNSSYAEIGWKELNSFALKSFEEHFANFVNEFTTNIDLTDSLYLRACDPSLGAWIRGENFYELEGTIQTTIFRYHWVKCKYDSCNTLWSAQSKKCGLQVYDRRSACSGTSAECAYLSAIEACVLKNGPYKFQYVNSTELGLLGKNTECSKDNGYLIEDGTGWNYTFAACACNCYEDHNKISLSIIESRITFNKVITGLRFMSKNQILYIQPREGILGANGYIIPYSERWIPVPKNSQIQSINRDNGVFFLDDVRLPPYFVLTGVKFNKVTRGSVTGFAIEVFGVQFDYKSGKLYTQDKFRTSRQAPNNHPWESLSFTAVSSLHTTVPHKPDSSEIQYVSLKRSTLSDDFGQSTLPFFDAVPVTPKFSSILGGIGIFHKGAAGYAGFISLRVFGIRYTEYFLNLQINHIADGRVLFNDSRHD